ncbi:FHA domain-containing protein [Spirochaeta cellobiosiphila]|uniref:FHA domain-containing protein n=1 Tax=Spirochaeta cellobiosiphila TaxID=504483 RepID=UPI0003FDFEE6|nr:FHA domain-containing protein [Spirochaeta cellobiosiphila]
MAEHLLWYLEGKMYDGESLIISIDKSPYKIGRSEDCDLTLSSPKISRVHAQLSVWKDTLSIEDMDSTNGTFVNNKQTQGEIVLTSGDVLQIGDNLFKITKRQLNDGPDFSRTLIHESKENRESFADHYGLSKREAEVLFYLLDGKSGTTIAEALCVSPGTAKHHILSIYKKTETHSKLELSTLYRNYELFTQG